ncbi:hypothetical protein PFFVO_06066, partial [Plasmodium falciparum Vietnam Oak-Knoll (FVO)]
MAPPDRGGTQDGADKYKTAPDAKHLLDMIGKDVHDLVKSESNGFKDDLKGDLNTANGHTSELVSTDKTCDLVKEYISKVGATNSDPCTNLSGKVEPRFSNTLGGQCTNKKIEGNEYIDRKDVGACAPYRRLHLCSHNLESIETTSTTTNKLLLEVCLAAKHEGETLTTQHGQHQLTNNESQLCTVLARSFADIGDIVRGKDLFLGNDKEKDQRKQLDDKLKKIFGKIYEGLTTTRGKNAEELQERYKKDEENYYQLREDWWDANRATIWEAITCGVHGSDYFRATCGGDGKHSTLAKNNCRCKDEKGKNDTDQVPTYFDYVPQYLRWFEEWAEDFCRKRKHKLKDVIEKCRGENGSERYCSGNGFDCKETVRGDEHFVEKDCHDCSYSCSPFVKWIDNQKLEFLKQRKKYETEISGGGSGKSPKRTKRAARSSSSSDDNGYESKFYKKLKEVGYQDVDKFLKILNKEGICQKQPQVGNEKADNVDFTNEKYVKTFSRTEICEPCPWCGVEPNGPPWKVKGDKTCGSAKTKTYDPKNITDIPVLYPDKSQQNILKKYKNFCEKGAPGGGQIKKWQCYYDEHKPSSKNNNNCVEGTWDKFTQGKQTVKSYNVFFWDWVHDMLHDSVEWKTELSKCINNNTNGNTCRNNNKCKTDCGCFQKWVEKKQQEWMAIKDHFGKQTDIVQQKGLIVFSPYGVLDLVLKGGNLLQNIKDVHGDTDDIKHIKKLLDEEDAVAVVLGGKDNTTIDKLLQHEKEQAEQCKQKQEECEKKAQQESRGRSAETREDERTQQPADSAGEVEEEEDDEDDDVVQEEEEEKEEGTVAEVTEVVEETVTEQEGVKPCDIVDKLFEDDKSLQAACSLKYGPGGKEKFPNWKCISSGSGSTATSSESESPKRQRREASGNPTGSSGAICVPPRRRKLYLGGFKRLTDGTTEASSEATLSSQAQSSSSSSSTPSPSNSRDVDGLRDAFIQSAAIETFFLWDRYKKENTKSKDTQGVATGLQTINRTLENSGEQNPEQELQKGHIPPDFLRLMFYTLGDYRDICIGDEKVIEVLKASGDNTMKKINDKIKENLSKQPGPPTVPQNSVKNPSSWWDQNGQHIWRGMICALTYKEASGSDGEKKIEKDGAVYNKFFGENNNDNPGTNTGTAATQKGTYQEKYEYKNVKLDENSDTEDKTTGGDTPLTQFVLRPPYFRYLEEWGETFCRQRTRMLEKIRGECKVEENGGTKNPKCSCYGEDCNDNLIADPSIFPDFNCPRCGKHCRSYKKWIETKRKEFDKQKKAYKQQKDNYVNEQKKGAGRNNDNNVFRETLENYKEAKDFLNRLGSCKKDSGEGNGKDILDFSQPDDTFRPAENCKPCPKFTVKCKVIDHCDSTKGDECQTKNSIEANDIGKRQNSAEDIGMLVSDDNTNGFDGDLDECVLGDCKSSGIFKGIRKEEWKCRNVCGYNVCKPVKVNGQNGDGNQIIIIRALFKIWLEYFLQDYNKIRTKLKPCIENGNASTCINGCNKKCNCVGEWISTKKDEWEKIKEHYKKQKPKNGDKDLKTLVTDILSALQPQTDVKKATGRKNISDFENSCHCNGPNSSQKKEGEERDLVVCLIEKLRKEAEKCEEKHQNSGSPEVQCQDPPPELDEEDLLLEEEEENT